MCKMQEMTTNYISNYQIIVKFVFVIIIIACIEDILYKNSLGTQHHNFLVSTEK